jgi:putative ABC transport system substrate-binding protein
MKRRAFMTLAGAAATALAVSPTRLAAQMTAKPLRLGALHYGAQQGERQMETVLRELREFGYVFGQNLTVDYRYAEGRPENLPRLAAELVGLAPNIILAFGGDVAPSVHEATRTIPIVFAVSADPVRLGLVDSLRRPGGNATGVTYLHDQLAGKRVQILKELAPGISRIAFIWNPEHPDNELDEAMRAARELGVQLLPLAVRSTGDFADAFRTAVDRRADAAYTVSSRLTAFNLARIVDFARENRIPLAGGWGAWVRTGALMSYGPNVNEMNARLAAYVSKIHRGAKPADLPVEQPSRFELLINVKVAKTLGLAIPETTLVLADEVIE